MNFLNEIIQAQCLFKNDTQKKCSGEKPLNMIVFCKTHAKIFNVATVEEVFVSGESKSKSKIKVLKYVDIPKKFLPFPFQYKKEQFCLVESDLNNLNSQNFSGMDCNHDLLKYTGMFISLLTNGFLYTGQDFDSNSSVYKLGTSNSLVAAIDNRWRNVNILAKVDDENEQLVEISMEKLPLLYKIIFSFAGISTIQKLNDSGNVTKTLSHSPNIMLNLKERRFEIINSTREDPIYILKDEATYHTPVILCASVASKTEYPQYSLSFADKLKIPKFCNSIDI